MRARRRHDGSTSVGLWLPSLGVGAQPPTRRVADAAMRGDTEGVRTLLRGGADVNAAQGDGMTALHWTALEDDLETMNVLLYAGAATEALTRVGAYTPLHLASSRGHAAASTRLLEAGSKTGPFTATGVQPLHLAAQAGNAQSGQGAARSRRRHQRDATRRMAGRRSSSRRRRIASTP